MALALTIAGVTKELQRGSLHITMTANGRSTAACQVFGSNCHMADPS